MKNPSNIAHPLKNRTGTSQRNRVIQALGTDAAPIDGKTLADRLYLINNYARQINFYQYKKTETDGESQELNTWSLFFEDSLPFQLAILSKTSIDKLETQFLLLYEELEANPSKESLESLFNFIFNKIITPITLLYKSVEYNENSFTESLVGIIKSSFLEPIASYICLYNSSANFLCITKKNFIDFIKMPWQLKVDEIYALDLCIKYVKKGKKEAFLKAGDVLNTIFYQVLTGMQNIVIAAPDYIEESLIPLKESLQKKHEPHIALLFAFLELFKHFQGNINELTKKHLDFFYEEVLKMVPKEAVPDMAHIVFEVANHQDAYLLKKDLLLKDGKDLNKQDIQFGLDQEIVIDKAQVNDLRTLSLYPIENSNTTKFIEGVYMAPVAKKADGKEKDFKDDQPKNWPTLGSKYSKCILEGKETPEDYPKARLGFALASPVLLLQEGKRSIKIVLNCDLVFQNDEERESITSCLPAFITASNNNVEPLFKIWFSGEKEWIQATPTIIAKNPSGKIEFEINVTLMPEIEPVTFFDETVLNEKLNLKESQPVVKIELNEDIEIECDIPSSDINCCLRKKDIESPQNKISPYNFLKCLKLVDADIDVKVCGVKNLIVQNDEGTLDIKSQLFPFGLRPEVPGFDPMNQLEPPEGTPTCKDNTDDNNASCFGSSFYIGSKEVLFKKWDSIRVNLEWKDKPDSFNDYYKAYLKKEKDLDVTTDISKLGLDEDDFRLRIGKLKDGTWNNLSKIKLFEKTVDAFGDLTCDTTVYGWEVENKGVNSFIDYNQPIDLFKNSLNGFLRFTLANQDFLHKEYPFVLARQMLAYANTEANGGKKLTDAIYIEESGKTVIHPFLDFSLVIEEVLTDLSDELQKIHDAVEAAIEFLQDDTALLASVENVKTQLTTISTSITTFLGNPFDLGAITTFLTNLGSSIHNLTIGNGAANQAFGDVVDFIANALLELRLDGEALDTYILNLKTSFDNFYVILDNSNILKFFNTNAYQALIPNEPWTPIIKNLYIDYSASAEKNNMDIIHLYPYENTSKHEDIEQSPTLFPYFDAEGTLFIGIENITKGGNLSILFQLAEATANSELDRAQVDWAYLSENKWKPLAYDFDIISDETDGFTVSGIVTIAVPDDINNNGNTIMPDPLYWIRASSPKNVKATAEIIGVHTQAVKTSARFSELSDKSRLENELKPGSISKLVEGDFNVKKVEQIYPAFGGRKPEANGHFYTRVSEHLKHKGRALMLNDYEKIVLEGFPEIYKAKCITHTMGLSAISYERDLEIAPGYVVLTVIPDLTKLKSGNLQEPKVPISLLEKIGDHIRIRTSPFARLKVMNPRFEYVDVTISVRLHRGKSDDFYKQKLKDDIHLFLAPWSLGDSEKLAFGQAVLFSDIVGFVEQLEYVDFISELDLVGPCGQTGSIIKPLTARSVLTGGTLCVDTDKEECPEDNECIDKEPIILINHIN
ncbi:baseplate J/gp47 family protein [Psychroserpens luteolus]|uniref:hypothetical protein n=1 Tax=Psychroserpens luteolus TaxID=2855840 RepID=UPI001E370207|nr:hypothetical protein [Psychroserpens luteolus]MCD2257712.1 hypothetical protein [Psychroserpens luteolus]